MSEARVRKIKRGQRRERRERRRLLLAGGTALSVALGSALSVANFVGVDVAAAAVSKAQNFLDLMHRRSPGQRTEARLTKHKHSRVLAERPLPELPEIIAPAPYTPAVALFAPPLQPTAAAFPETPQLLAEKFASPLFYAPPIGGIFAPPPPPGGGGGGGPPGGPGGPPQQPPPGQPFGQPPGVPEPATWAMMILGFGLSGWVLRRQREDELRALASRSS
jgi:hypothetical protein